MAKASATITVTMERDISSVTRYYKLQASTASVPAKPTTLNPTGWTTTEPTYTEGSTNSLYTTDCTVFTDGTFSYSDVSLSSSYEAAKTAYNKAVNSAQTATKYITAIDQNGIKVHAESNPSTNYAQIDATGMGIYQGVDGVATEVAAFKASGARIGQSGKANINVEPDLVTLNDPDGEVALFLKYTKITTQDMEYRYGVSVRDENNLSYLDIYPESGGRTFTGYLTLRTLMGTHIFTTPNGSYATYTDQGFTYRNNNSDVLASVGSSGNVHGAGNVSAGGNMNASGNITAAGDITAVGDMTAQGNVNAAGTIKQNGTAVSLSGHTHAGLIAYEDVTCSVTYTAGTVGTRGTTVSLGTTVKTGYVYLGAMVIEHQSSATFSCCTGVNPSNNAGYLACYRASTGAASNASVLVRKIWVKT